MKLYQVYTINPVGEKTVEFTTINGDDAEDFLAQIDGALGWEFDYGIDEKEIDAKSRELPEVKFYYVCEDEFGQFDFCTRDDAIYALRIGRRVTVEMSTKNLNLIELPYIDGFKCEWPIEMPWAPETDFGFHAVEDDDLPF